MSQPPASAEERYTDLIASLLDCSGATFDPSGRGSGPSALKTGGKIFAMLVKDRLVVKLPRQRVDALVVVGLDEIANPRVRSRA